MKIKIKIHQEAIFIATVIFLLQTILNISMAIAQIKPTTSEAYDVRFRLAAEYQNRNLPRNFSITFFGLNGEARMNERVGLSGSLLYGFDNQDVNFLHLPPLGILLFTVSALVMEPDEDLIIFLLFENLHYYLRMGNRFIVSPYLNLMSLDMPFNKENQVTHSLVSSGIGINAQMKIYKQLVLSAEAARGYLWLTDRKRLGRDRRFTDLTGISLGITF